MTCRIGPVLALLFLCQAFAGFAAGAELGEAGRADTVKKLCTDGQPRLDAIEAMVKASAASSEDAAWSLRLLNAIANKKLLCGSGGAVLKDGVQTADPITFGPAGAAETGAAPFINLKVRAALEMGTSLVSLIAAPASALAEKAVAEIEKSPRLASPAALEKAIEVQAAPALKERLETVRGIRALNDPDPEARLKAIALIAGKPSQKNLTTLLNLASDPAYASDGRIKAALDRAIPSIKSWLFIADGISVLYSGLSYASILFLASAGLAIIFGLLGVINLAQGELIMIGAYATYLVQQLLKLTVPQLLDYYIILAIPMAFLAAALIGVVMEVTVIRHLYRRPLVSLLATWAVSLLLINTVRVCFGTQNLEIVTPSFLEGGFRVIGDSFVTWNRLFAILCALATFALAMLTLKYTKLGLYIRAVITNRDMADCIGVSVRRVDLLSFGIGSGLAGLAGLALSPIYNVNPTMGSNFIVDAFMIVVLGGIGSIVGTLVASLGVGIVNVAIEPLYGAVAAKVIVLLMIIAFIQFRPEGMFAVKGRR
jgi:urea transport system permease protein